MFFFEQIWWKSVDEGVFISFGFEGLTKKITHTVVVDLCSMQMNDH